jgi:hypothetical protein
MVMSSPSLFPPITQTLTYQFEKKNLTYPLPWRRLSPPNWHAADDESLPPLATSQASSGHPLRVPLQSLDSLLLEFVRLATQAARHRRRACLPTQQPPLGDPGGQPLAGEPRG